MIKEHYRLDTKNGVLITVKKTPATLTAKQYDTARSYVFALQHGGNDDFYDLNNKTVRFKAQKPDGKRIYLNGKIVSTKAPAEVQLDLGTQLLLANGLVQMEMVIYEGRSTVSSTKFQLQVESAVFPDEVIESEDEFTALTEALDRVDKWDVWFEDKYNGLEEEYADKLTGWKVYYREFSEE